MTGSTAWTLDDCRREYRELRDAHEAATSELQAVSQNLAEKTYALELARNHVAQLERDLAASQRREAALASELVELKRAMGAGHTQLATVTPLRPPGPPKSSG